MAAEPIVVKGKPVLLRVKEGGTSVTYNRIRADAALEFSVKGPSVLALDIRELRRRRKAKGSPRVSVTALRDRAYRSEAVVKLSDARGRGGRAARGLFYSAKLSRQLRVPPGQHDYVLTLRAEQREGFAVRLLPASREVARLMLGPEEALLEAVASAGTPQMPLLAAPPPAAPAAPTTPAMDNSATHPTTPEVAVGTAPVQSPTSAPIEAAAVSGRQTRLNALGVSESTADDASSAAVAGAAGPVPVTEIASSDDSVAGATRALADAVAKGFAAKGAPAAFYRVAVPYFEELGEEAQQNNLGRLLAELLAVELSQRQPFVVVERERLDQIMREHRLKGLGLIDEQTASEFGKVLGAQSLISGTVAEAGPQYLVAVRQVDVESGAVLVSGQVGIDRAGLVALSSEAVVLRSKAGAVFRSALVPGWGQFYNGDTSKGALFFGAGAGTMSSALGFYIAGVKARARYQKNRAGTVDQRALANRHFSTTNYLLMAYGALWALNLLDGYFGGRESTSVQVAPRATGVQVRF